VRAYGKALDWKNPGAQRVSNGENANLIFRSKEGVMLEIPIRRLTL
jgi:hypothetical protein